MRWCIVDDNGLLPLWIQRGDEILKHFYHHKTIDRPLDQIRRKGIVASEETQRLQAFTSRGFQLDGLPFLLPSIGDIGDQREEGLIKVI
mgnify:FL=1